MKTVGALAACLAALIASSAAAQEQKVCKPRADVLAKALKAYGEGPVAFGGLDEKHVIELLRSADDSWTIIQTDVNGRSCVMASGIGWDDYAEPPLPGRPM